MHKVNVSVPAVSTNVGPGYDVLGLALNLRNVIEMSLDSNDALVVHVRGEGSDRLTTDFYNPAMRAAIKLFQLVEQAPAGLNLRLTNFIPLDVGLSARTALIVGGLVGANNLLGSPFNHDAIIRLASDIAGQPEAVVAAMRGGLGVVTTTPDGIIYRTVEVEPLRVVLALPTLPAYQARLRPDLPGQVLMNDAIYNIGHTALLIESLRTGDYALLKQMARDRLHEPYRRTSIPGYDAAQRAAEDAGAIAVTICGAGPTVLAFATFNHQSIEQAMVGAFQRAGFPAQAWSVGVDLQGVVISVVE